MPPIVSTSDEIVFEVGGNGDLRKITRSLRSGRVDLDGIAASRSGETRIVRMLPRNAEQAMLLLDDVGIPYRRNRVVTAPLEDTLEALDEIVGRLADAGIETESIHPPIARAGGPVLALHVDDPDRAKDVLLG